MTPSEYIFAGLMVLAGGWALWRLAQPAGTATDDGVPRLRIFMQVCLRALFALAPFVAIAVGAIWLVILPLGGAEGLNTALGAMITGTVVAVGWVASAAASEFRQAIERDITRRDTLVALRSEIVTFVETLDRTDIIADGYRVLARIREGGWEEGEGGQPTEYYPYATADSDPVILHAVSQTLPSLRNETVAVVVRFYAQLTDLKALVLDSRSAEVHDLPRERRVAFHAILVRRRLEVLRRGLIAIVAINTDLEFQDPTRIERTGKNPDVTPTAAIVRFDINDERARP